MVAKSIFNMMMRNCLRDYYGVCGSGECVVWVEVGKSFMWCVVWEGEEGMCGDEFGTYRPPKNDTLTRRAVQQAMAGVGGIFWGAYRYHISHF